MKKYIKLKSVAIIGVLAIASCGGGNNAETSSSPQGPLLSVDASKKRGQYP